MHKPVVAIGVSCVLMAFATASAQQRTAREALREPPNGWDRSQLIRSSTAGALDEATAPLRCATRPVGEAEKDLVEMVVASQLPQRDAAALAGKITIPVTFHIVRKKNGTFDVN